MQAYKQFSVAAVVPRIESVAQCIVAQLPKPIAAMDDIITPPENAFTSKGNWTRKQTILAFHFYCQTPFGQLHAKNEKIIELAQLIGRTPSALAMKCVNIASIDPTIKSSGRTGLSNASMLDKEIWQEFHDDWDGLVEQAETLLAYLRKNYIQHQIDEEEVNIDYTGETRITTVKQRIKQAFFRRSVLSSYGGRCCITGVSDSRFLVASHIVAWRDDASIRLDPANGLCLSTIHDRAFDNYLFSLTDDYRIILSKALRDTQDKFLRDIFWPLADTAITLPERFVPNPAFIARHREKIGDI